MNGLKFHISIRANFKMVCDVCSGALLRRRISPRLSINGSIPSFQKRIMNYSLYVQSTMAFVQDFHRRPDHNSTRKCTSIFRVSSFTRQARFQTAQLFIFRFQFFSLCTQMSLKTVIGRYVQLRFHFGFPIHLSLIRISMSFFQDSHFHDRTSPLVDKIFPETTYFDSNSNRNDIPNSFLNKSIKATRERTITQRKYEEDVKIQCRIRLSFSLKYDPWPDR